jgi:putative DNA primase/helicase
MIGRWRGADNIDFAVLIGPVAKYFWGEPNESLSRKNELRWGSKGSRVVSLSRGTWYSHETGESGGTLDLISSDHGAAVQWLKDHGLVSASSDDAQRRQARRD